MSQSPFEITDNEKLRAWGVDFSDYLPEGLRPSGKFSPEELVKFLEGLIAKKQITPKNLKKAIFKIRLEIVALSPILLTSSALEIARIEQWLEATGRISLKDAVVGLTILSSVAAIRKRLQALRFANKIQPFLEYEE